VKPLILRIFWMQFIFAPMSTDDRHRVTIDFSGLVDRVESLKTTIDWRELSFGKKIRVLLEERLAMGEDVRETMRQILGQIESGDGDEAAAYIAIIIESLSVGSGTEEKAKRAKECGAIEAVNKLEEISKAIEHSGKIDGSELREIVAQLKTWLSE
jgi:hypothetical protein